MNNSKDHIDFWIACSGGVDSVVLVRLFKALNKNFGILHCNFKLRGNDSDKDENFVRDLADEIDVPIKVKVFDVKQYIEGNGGNTQLAARDLRYQWFEDVKSKSNARIVLGHHKDDQVETFLLQLKRGGKLKGLSSMIIYNKGYFRPLLKYTKEEVYDLAIRNGWYWTEDLSNKESDYQRNYYRNELIPNFKDENALKAQVIDLVEDFQVLLIFVEQYLVHQFDFSKDVKVSFDLWDSWPYWFKHLFISKSGISPLSVREVDRLRATEKGKYLKNDNICIWNEGDTFYIGSENKPLTSSDYEVKLISVEDVEYREGEVFLDKGKVHGQVSLRLLRRGDTFQPLGMKGKKKVSKFLKDRKVLSSQKKSYSVIVDETNRVLGIAGMCPDECFKVDENTKRVYRIKKK